MAGSGNHDAFVMQMIAVQTRLYAYVLSLVLDRERASEILQQTNLVMLEKAGEFEEGTNFSAWAYRVAFYEVLADRRKRSREKHLFNDELLALVASHSSTIGDSLDDRSVALEDCLSYLPDRHRQLITQRYRPGGSVAALAESLRKTPAAVSTLLYRIRSELLECTQKKLSHARS
ncbi:RNA polymerase sigma factor [Posidoniimonas corsicana]|uniref:RNA polymerase sigma factor n=2 Tax=Posidoniimonas corsicana TaxID=1938618 RepID=A0A5C5VET5_9BACT|nr:RNA polymerase sigma factor [Posidoniimonas corsicana]